MEQTRVINTITEKPVLYIVGKTLEVGDNILVRRSNGNLSLGEINSFYPYNPNNINSKIREEIFAKIQLEDTKIKNVMIMDKGRNKLFSSVDKDTFDQICINGD